ncbi:MAG TPA: hypothetical protein VGU20_32650 [Stellaceae bacterium]|nr:hypothetical protein [Stellaceae bacterium]
MSGGAVLDIRLGALSLALAVGAAVMPALPAAAETDSAAVEQWRATDRSMAELVDDGYELVSVVAASGQSHTYFLRKPGKVARCREQTTVDGPPPSIPPFTLAKGQKSAVLPPLELPKMRVDIECAELVRPQQGPR